jgi:hypothetical protein
MDNPVTCTYFKYNPILLLGYSYLKGLSHEIDLKNFDQTLKNLT